MSQFSWSLIEVNLLILLLFMGYMAVRNRLAFEQQRVFLVGIPFVAIASILIKSWIDLSEITYSLAVVELEPVMIGGTNIEQFSVQSPAFPFMLIYGIGALCVGLLLVFRLLKLRLFFIRNHSEVKGKYRIYQVEEKPSFSFFNHIQITPSLSAEEQNIVLEHEKMHVDKKHSIDTILIELFHVLFWFNPVFLFIKRELINLHEYEVDALMYKNYKVHYLKFLVNYALGIDSSHYLLTSRFYNQLTLKKRIKIMKKNIRKQSWMLSIIPIIGMVAILFQCTKSNDATGDNRESIPNQVIISSPEEEVFEEVEKYPEFVGGIDGMTDFIVENVVYPEEAKEQNVEGIVYVQFVVASDGALKNVNIVGRTNELLDPEALRVVSLMPNWTPGENKGKKVAVRFTLPISFKLN